MKKTLFMTTILALGMSSAFALSPSSGTTYKRGDTTTTSGMVLTEDMKFGTLGAGALGGVVSVANGQTDNLCAGGFTLSLWIDTSKISANTQLFGYYGSTPANARGMNGLILNADGTLTMGNGKLDGITGASGTFTLDADASRHDTTTGSIAFGAAGGLTNITLTSKGPGKDQTIAIYLNGALFDTLTYTGNMSGATMGKANFDTFLNPTLTYGEVQVTPGQLAAGDIAAFAKVGSAASVPEPTTATLGLLGLIALVMHRRRRA